MVANLILLCSFKTYLSLKTWKLLTQKYDDVINTQQARRSEWNETRDLLGFNTKPADSENPTTCQSI